MALVRVKDIFPKKVPYKIIETAGVQNPPESCFDKAPSADGKALGDPKNRINSRKATLLCRTKCTKEWLLLLELKRCIRIGRLGSI